MKYVITESKLNKVIFKYLDMKLNGVEERKGRYVDIVFTFPNEEYGLLGWKKSGHLSVYHRLSDEIQNLFGLKDSDALNFIGRYVEDRYNLEVKNTEMIESILDYLLKTDTI
jgi:hypothetical protein